jgi:hypothetical protein
VTRRNSIGWRSLAGLGVFAAILMTGPVTSPAQTAANSARPLSPDLVVPTTKLLAIGSFTARATPSLQKSILPAEVRATVRLYLDGKIDQWYLQQDQSGVVFVMNITDPQEARTLLDKLPLGQAGLMEFKFIQLGPISPLRLLLTDTAK